MAMDRAFSAATGSPACGVAMKASPSGRENRERELQI
jgi:hypothetical protein